MIIYKITNNINGKVYIGQTIGSLKERFKYHAKPYSQCRAMKSAIKKYGKENFTIEEIGGANSHSELDYQEWLLVYLNNSIAPNGYNLKEGGNSRGKCSDNTKLKMSQAQLGKKHTQETRAKISKSKKGTVPWNKGLECSKETKAKLSLVNTGNSAWNKDVKQSKDHKTKAAISRSKSVKCLETGEIFYGSEEASRKMDIAGCNISRVCRGIRKTAGGYHFEYISEGNNHE